MSAEPLNGQFIETPNGSWVRFDSLRVLSIMRDVITRKHGVYGHMEGVVEPLLLAEADTEAGAALSLNQLLATISNSSLAVTSLDAR